MKKRQKLFFLLLVPFLTIALADTPVLSATTAKIYVGLPLAYKEKDGSLKVDIKIEDVVDLYSWQVNLRFDTGVLEFVNVTEGDFLKEQPEGTYGAPPLVGEDYVFFGWSTVGKYTGVTGTGTLATVELRVTTIGESILNISYPTKLVEIHPPPIPPGGEIYTEIPYTTQNGIFTNLLDPPRAEFTFSPSFPKLNEQITFDASASSATAPRVIDSYQWDFGDGTKKIYVKDVNLTSTTTYTYTTSGNFTVSLTVTDNATATDLVQAMFGTTTMPRDWYELYSKKTASVNILFGHDIAVTNVIASRNEVMVGEIVSINVTVLNKGAEAESFDVTTYYGNSVIETKGVTDLVPEGEQTLIFDWDTTDVSAGDYQIRAEAPLEGDGNPNDNSLIDGTVTVNPTEPFPVWVIGAVVAVVAVVVLAVIVFLYMRRRSSSP